MTCKKVAYKYIYHNSYLYSDSTPSQEDINTRPSGIGPEALVGGTAAARGGYQMLLHLLVVGDGNSCDPGPDGLGRRLSGEHNGGCAARSGRRSGGAAATTSVLLNTARSDRIDLIKRVRN
jgi:hypothetical protein